MTILASALRESGNQTAAYDAADGVRVIVKRVTGPEGVSDAQESYAVFVQRGDSLPQDRFDVDDLVLAQEQLRDLSIPGFAPDSANWRPLP